MALLANDNFIIDIVINANPSLTVEPDFKSNGPYGVDVISSLTVFFYYDGGAGSKRGRSFALRCTAINGADPGSAAVPSASAADFNPVTPIAGRPTPPPTTMVAGTRLANVYYTGAGYYHSGSVPVAIPGGQTEDTSYDCDIEMHS